MPPYLDTNMQSRWWEFGGDTIIRTDKFIRLTSDQPSRDGWIWSKLPLTATNWEIEVEFAIHGAGNLHGDGMAMWLTKEKAKQGQVFGSMDNFEGLGLFIDTYKNNRPGTVFPYVMAMYGDGKTSYDKENDGKVNEFAGCSARGIRGADIPTKLRLTYFQDKSLKLELQYKTEGEWIVCFEKENPPSVPTVAYLGFSAETGELSDNHDIIRVESKNLYSKSGVASGKAQQKSQKGSKSYSGDKYDAGRKKSSGWTWFFIKMVLLCVVLGGGYVGYTAYRSGKLMGKRSHRF
jgi:mannose-binding lectin 2